MNHSWQLIFFCGCTLSLSWAEEASTTPSNPPPEILQGTPVAMVANPNDQLMAGMFSLHTNSSSFKSRNWNQKMMGFQKHDYFACTFENSFFNRTYAIGIAKNFQGHRISSQWETTLGYRLGLIYGYEEGQAPLSGYSPVIPMVGIYKRYIYQEHYGVEFMFTTVASVSFFYQF